MVDNGDGTSSMTCPDGTSATFGNVPSGQDGPSDGDGPGGSDTNGGDHASCTIIDQGQGVRTISCPDGTKMTISDSQDIHILPDTIQGSFTVRNSLDIARIASVTEITGNLIFDARGLVSFELPLLRTVGGNVNISSMTTLKKFSMSALTSVGGDLQIRGNATLTDLSGLDGLTSVGSNIRIDSNAICQSDIDAFITRLQNAGWSGDLDGSGETCTP